MIPHPPSGFNPQFFVYYFLPTTPPPTLSQPIRTSTTIVSSNQHEEPLENLDERIIVTKQDLEREGYEKTKNSWTEAQDRLLLRLCRNEELKFEQIANMIEGRNAKMCYSRYRRLTNQARVGWTKTEDQRLLRLVEQHGDDDWKNIATFFERRTHKQVRDHYINYLKPDINKSEWTLEEDMQLIHLINSHGKNWKVIEEGLPGRSRNQVKNRFFGKITRLNNKKLEALNRPSNE